MKLRRWFPLQQLLFAALVCIAIAARAQDTLTLRDGRTQVTKILGVSASGVQIQLGAAGTITIPMANIAKVTMAPPANFTSGMTAYAAGDLPTALSDIKAVVDKFKGLPTDWAQQATAALGDIYVAQNKFSEAEAAYKDFEKWYAASGSQQAEVGMARVDFSKKAYADATKKLEPILAQALKVKVAPKETAATYSQAFYLSGQLKEASGDFSGALEDYLRTVALFPQDRIALANAQERADAVRKEHGVAAP